MKNLRKLCKLAGIFLLLSQMQVALAAPVTFVYEGVLTDSGGTPITVSTTLTLSLYNPALGCLLYQEQQSVTPDAHGSFSVLVGSATGDSKRTAADPALAMDTVFKSSGTVRSAGTNCSSGYSAGTTDIRRLVVAVDGTTLTPTIALSSSPFALNASRAENFAGYDSSKVLRTDGTASIAALDDAKVTLLTNILNGTLGTPTNNGDVASKAYVDSALASVPAGMPTSLASGKVWVGNASGGAAAVSFSGDATISNTGSVALSTTGVIAGTYSKVTVDSKGRVNTGAALALADITGALGYTPGSSTAGFANGGNSFGTSASLGTNDGFDLIFKTNSLTRMSVKTSGDVEFSNQIKISGGAPGAGKVLTSDSSGLATWQTPAASGLSSSLASGNIYVGSAGGTATATLLSGDATMNSSGSVTVMRTIAAAANKILGLDGSGVATVKGLAVQGGSGTVTLQSYATSGTYGLTLPIAAATADGQVMSSTTTGMMSWMTPARVTTANLLYYVRNDGSDSTCNGTADASAASAPNCAFLTLQGALDKVPEVVLHTVNIKISTNLTSAAANVPMAVINKSIGALNETAGPFLKIEGNAGVKVISSSGSGATGLLILNQARGVYLANLSFSGFQKSALDIDGGIVLAEQISISNSYRGVEISRGGNLMFTNTASSISLAIPSTNSAVGISLSGGARVSQETNLTITLPVYNNTRGIDISDGEYELSGTSTLTIGESASSMNITGVQISKAGTFSSDTGSSLIFNMSSSNSYSSAIRNRGGALSIQGALSFNYVSGSGLVCELGASCEVNGPLTYANTGGLYSRPIVVSGGSTLTSSDNLMLLASIASGNAAVDISGGSNFVYSPQVPSRSMQFSGSAGSTLFRLSGGSHLNVTGTYGISFNIISGTNLVQAAESSSANFNNSSTSSGSLSSNYVYLDSHSTYSANVNGVTFPLASRTCASGMTAYGKGSTSFCMDSSYANSAASDSFYNANTFCANNGKKLCTLSQHAIRCATDSSTAGNPIWVADGTTITCSPSTWSVNDYGGIGGVTGNSKQYRCCN